MGFGPGQLVKDGSLIPAGLHWAFNCIIIYSIVYSIDVYGTRDQCK